MTLTDLQKRKSEGGFTLVELAIVMIIIGLLIGGILKGQELIANAQVTATIAQVKGIEGAVATFRDKYSAMPGDMANAGTRLRNCTGACATGAPLGVRGNGRIDTPTTLGALPTTTSEGVIAFTHLAASDLISGVIINGGLTFGGGLPEAKMGGGFWLGFTPTGAANGIAATATTAMRAGHYLVYNGLVQATGGTNGGITPSQAARVDRKIDDGNPGTGASRAIGTGCSTGTGAAALYSEANESGNCSMYLRVQG